MCEHMCIKYVPVCVSRLGFMNPLSRPGQGTVLDVCGGGMNHEDTSPSLYWIWSGGGMVNQYIADKSYDPNWIWIWIYPVWDSIRYPVLTRVDPMVP